jgi:hypothetical protein
MIESSIKAGDTIRISDLPGTVEKLEGVFIPFGVASAILGKWFVIASINSQGDPSVYFESELWAIPVDAIDQVKPYAPPHSNFPPLPLVDGCLFFDNSTLEKLTTCMRSVEYYKLRNRVKADSKPSLRFGSAIHEALQERYSNPDYIPGVSEEMVFAKLRGVFETQPCEDEGWRNKDTGITTLKNYLKQDDDGGFETLHHPVTGQPLVELPFAVPIASYPHPTEPGKKIILVWMGKIDRAVKQVSSGQVFVWDHKTTSMLGPSFMDAQAVSDQFLGYMFGLEQTIGIRPQGYIINAICTRAPSKTGKQNEFQRQTFYKPWEVVDEWRTNTIHLLQRFFDSYARGYFPKETSWCLGKFGKCPYYDVCEMPPQNRLEILSSNMYADNIWTPLKDVDLKALTAKINEEAK